MQSVAPFKLLKQILLQSGAGRAVFTRAFLTAILRVFDSLTTELKLSLFSFITPLANDN